MNAPDPPAGLLKASRDRWAAFWASSAAMAIDTASDMPRLVRWIQASDEYDRAAKVVRTTRLVKGSMGQPVLNPLVNYLAHLDGLITRAEADFGMTPAARRRLDMPATQAAVSPLDELRSRRERKFAAG